jgi:hypothetical protein
MVLFAFSIEDQVEKYGAYVGIAAFFGLAILTLLYFAQAREVKRLREWAGRAPERAMELEQAVVEHAQEVRRAPEPAPVQRTVRPEPVPATNGAHTLAPAELAALAFARSAGVHEPHEPHERKPQPAPAAVAAAAPAPATQVVDPPVANGAGNGAPPPATPAARRADTPTPLPPRRKAPPTRRPPVAPAPRESNTRAVVLTAIIGVVVLAAAAALAFTVLGGDDPSTPPTNASNNGGQATATPKGGEATPKPTPASIKKSQAKIFLFNGTSEGGLAAKYQRALVGEAYPQANTSVGTLGEANQAQTSVVMYEGARARRAAVGVAQSLGIEQVVAIDDALKTALADAPEAKGKDWNVVVVIGQDKGTA